MNEYITRHEHDAKLSASEERMNAKFAEIMSEVRSIHNRIDVMSDQFNTRIETLNQRLADYRDDSRSSKWALWAMAITVSIATLIPLFEKYALVLR